MDTTHLSPNETSDTEALEPTYSNVEQEVREKITSLLETYPYISRSMIQVGIGPSLPPILWQPILDQMMEAGEIKTQQITTTKKRTRTAVIYHLADYPYPPAKFSPVPIS